MPSSESSRSSSKVAKLRVLNLTYRVVWHRPDFRVSPDASPLTGIVGPFNITMYADLLNAKPAGDYDDVESARKALEPLLRDWEIEWDVRFHLRLSFDIASWQMIDVKTGKISSYDRVAASGDFSLSLSPYPPVPSGILRDSPLGREVRARWHNVSDGRERILVCAYWILTRIEREFGSRQKAANTLGVSAVVLETIGKLAAKNDPAHGRKVKGPVEKLTAAELAWLRAVLDRVTTRVVEARSGCANLKRLTMSDFPKC
jgi:hypothetical protein